MKILKEFKEFAVRGNVMDMAIGIILGGAFGKVVSSVVNDVLLPPLGMMIGGMDFKTLKFILQEAAADKAEVAISYGNFIQIIIDFIIVAFAVFMLVKGLNRLKRKEEIKPTTPAAPSKEEELLTEIRDLLKAAK